MPPPSATDAQGAAVPVATSVEGDSLILEVSHRAGELAYPVLLDPEYVNDTTSFGEWSSSLNSGYEYYLNNNWSSLDAISRGHYYYPAYTHGQWGYGAYGQTAFIGAATFSPVDYLVNKCSTYEPHGYIGLYNPGSGQYDAYGLYATANSTSEYQTGWKGGTGTRDAIIGIGTASGVEIGCAHELYVGGYSIQEKDPEAPTVDWLGGTSGNWVKDITVTPHVSDPGLGVKAITLSPEGSDPQTNSQGCGGANGSRCPGSWETSFGGSYFAEGERSASISAYDPLGSSPNSDPNHVSSSYQFTTRIDRQKPEVELEGEFTEALEEAEEEGEGQKAPALHLPVYNLRIDATDKANEGDPQTEAKARRSGVKNLSVFLDGKAMKVPWSAQGCSGPEYSCPMEETYAVPMDEVQGGGVHKLKVIAEDQVLNKRERTIEFEYFPATGMKDEYVMQHFPLPDGEGDESEEEDPKRPELAVNVTNGNLVFRQRDVEVPGPAVDLEVERFYNSQLPEDDNTEWGDGWTLAQTPKLEPEEGKEEAPPAKASMVRTSGALESAVGLPTESGGAQFDKKLQAVVTNEPNGGYTVEDQSGETDTTLAFDEAGKVTELRTPGYAKIDYAYEAGDLSEIAVEDPARSTLIPEDPAPFPLPAYAFSFGSEGSGEGQLTLPTGAATDAQGDVYVADYGNNRIEKFDASGRYLASFGSKGTGPGQFKEGVTGVAVGPEGEVYATDFEGSRVEKFSSSGEYLGSFGEAGSGNGQFGEFLFGVAVDPEGDVYAADLEHQRVEKFSSSGEYLGQFEAEGPWNVAVGPQGDVYVVDNNYERIERFSPEGEELGSFGDVGEDRLSYPTGIAIDAGGDVWVADNGNSRVAGFGPAGEYLGSFGSEGSGEGQLSMPYGVAAAPGGGILAVDSGNGRVQAWEPSAAPLASTEAAGAVTKSGATLSGTVNPKGLATEYSFQYGTTSAYGETAPASPEEAGSGIEGIEVSQAVNGLSAGRLYHFRLVATNEDGTTYGEDETFATPLPAYAFSFGSEGSGNGQLTLPTGAATDAQGDVYVADYGNNRIEKFDASGRYLASFGSKGTGPGQFKEGVTGVAVGPEGEVYATDFEGSRVEKFSSSGEYLGSFGEAGSGNGQFGEFLFGVAVDPEGDVYAADLEHQRVEKFSSSGEYLGQFEAEGPWNVAVGPQGDVYVVDNNYERIERFSPEGEELGSFGDVGEDRLSYPTGIAIDAGGDVWVADNGNSRVAGFGPAGEYLGSFGSEGSGEGQLSMPYGVAAAPGGGILAVDSGNGRVQAWEPSAAPLASTEAAGAVTKSGATLSGTVNPKGLATEYSFQYGTTSAYGETAPASPEEAGSGIEGIEVSQAVNGLSAGRLYHFRLVATNEDGTTYGEDETFATPLPAYAFSFGSEGSGNGQLTLPTGAATDAQGDVYVADYGNNRIEKFDASGRYLASFGSKGTGPGQFKEGVTGVAVGPEGEVYATDFEGSRVEKFSSSGEYLGSFGEAGSGNGQFGEFLFGVAVDPEGDVYAADLEHQRVEKFSSSGEYLGQFEAEGPWNVAVGPQGDVYVVDNNYERIERFSPEGEELGSFGDVGEDRLSYPTGIAIDAGGDVWVADNGNSRVAGFGPAGEYLGSFGSEGSGEGQLSMPYGVAAAPGGGILAVDSGNGRVQAWYPEYTSSGGESSSMREEDPKVEVDTTAGLIDSVDVIEEPEEEPAVTTYSHEGEMLTAVDGLKGETQYEYDSEERLTKVTLPNGTWGEVKYDEFGRAKAVTVSVEGKEAKTTYFSYKEEPRRTTVSPEGAPITVYDIAPDGSVLKWWNKQEPPEIENLSGSLYANKETPGPIEPGDYELLVQAYSVEGIASIEIIANGNQLVDEKTCEQDYEKEGTECKTVEDPWVTETANWPPGILYLEVIVTDSVESTEEVPNTESAKFWVNIPYTPPPDPEAEEPPRFSEVLRFREEFGLDLDLKGNELAIDERIFDLIGDWNNPHTPAGEVARATDQRWGSPLRSVDAAEMDYREGYVASIGKMLEEWGPAERTSTYAGYSVNNSAGGIIEIGFTSEPATNLAAFEEAMDPPAQDRLVAYLASQGLSAVALVEKEDAVAEAIEVSATLQSEITEFWVEYEEDIVKVGTTDTSQVVSLLTEALGSLNGIDVIYQPDRPEYSSGRNRTTGRMLAGDRILNKEGPIGCTAGFGAYEQRQKKSNGETIVAPFFLTSGHCYAVGIAVWRSPYVGTGGVEQWDRVGEVTRSAFEQGVGIVDAEAVRIESAGLAPRHIFGRNGNRPKFGKPAVARRGQELCFSGAYTGGVRCGEVVGIRKQLYNEGSRPAGSVQIAARNVAGDSGSPVWDPKTGAAVGILRARQGSYTWVQPLLNTPNNHGDVYVGALQAAKMYNLHIMTGG